MNAMSARAIAVMWAIAKEVPLVAK